MDVVEMHDSFDITTLVCCEMVSLDLVKDAVFTPIARPKVPTTAPQNSLAKWGKVGALKWKKLISGRFLDDIDNMSKHKLHGPEINVER